MRKMKRRQKKQLALLTLVVLIASIISIMLLTPGFDIDKIEVRGNMVLKEQDVINASELIKGVNIFSVNLGEARDNVKSMGYVESVKIKRDLPSGIIITVVEEVGVAYLTAENGYIIITADGRCVEKRNSSDTSAEGNNTVSSSPDLPQITGIKNVKYKEGSIITAEDKRQLDALLKCLSEFTKSGYIDKMVEIDVTDITDIKFYYSSKKLCVTVGDTSKLDYKMECFGPIYDYVVEKTKAGEMPSGYVNLERLTYREKEIVTENKDTNPEKTQ